MGNDGGPAFAFREEDGQGGYQQFCGMSLRDYFAAKAMLGIITCPPIALSYAAIAEEAYKHADAMLAARRPTTQDAAKGEI